MNSSEIRRNFLAYFEKQGHTVAKSSSLIPHDDATLLFTNAGMVQFKRTFLGEEKRGYVRAATAQKCVRAGGKHNDLDNVGYTGRHHTFFEMLGNFSFGDYFKAKAIEYAWDLMTRTYMLPEEKLWVTVYIKDDEAYKLWMDIAGVREQRIVRLGDKDNFWAMGDTGPCGPCSEILIDQGEKAGCGKPDCSVGCDCDRYLELWNLVFMQFNRDVSGVLTPLPKPSIDTGMGLERISAIVQGAPNNYETDLFLPILNKISALCEKSYGASSKTDIAMRVVADHSRSSAFLISDGVLPSNEGRGYVLRRILRRAMRYGRTLGLKTPFLHQTATTVCELMSSAYPELKEACGCVQRVVNNEEERFLGTLDAGMRVLEAELEELSAKTALQVPGDLVFRLYDTYGFPADIVQDVVRDIGLTVDMDGFSACMDEQRTRSRGAWKGSGAAQFAQLADSYKQLSTRAASTDFVGYTALLAESNVLLIVRDGQEVSDATEGDEIELVSKTTPFYAESGGQLGDCGTISSNISGNNCKIKVNNVIKTPANIIIHKGTVLSGSIHATDAITLEVDVNRRQAVARNHTATHLLHASLREQLGLHVKQAGSLVAADYLRFDFTHFASVDDRALRAIESQINAWVIENHPLDTVEMDAEAALQSGATALFEEKYGDRVRVVSMGSFSKELCGGTHTQRTGDIGFFKITSQGSVAAGVRRIEALTGHSAFAYTQQAFGILHTLSDTLRAKPEELADRVQKIIANEKTLIKELASLKGRAQVQTSAQLVSNVRNLNGVPLLVEEVSADTPAALRDLMDQLRARIPSCVIVLGSKSGEKALLISGITKDLMDKYHAGNIIKHISAIVGGKGGGRPDMAQAGGNLPDKLTEALAAVDDIVRKMA